MKVGGKEQEVIDDKENQTRKRRWEAGPRQIIDVAGARGGGVGTLVRFPTCSALRAAPRVEGRRLSLGGGRGSKKNGEKGKGEGKDQGA